jgi:hypothetical protein
LGGPIQTVLRMPPPARTRRTVITRVRPADFSSVINGLIPSQVQAPPLAPPPF